LAIFFVLSDTFEAIFLFFISKTRKIS